MIYLGGRNLWKAITLFDQGNENKMQIMIKV